jgi:hypothetical protein
MRLLLVGLILGTSALCGCTTSSVRSNGGSPITGTWGGAHVGLALTETNGTISYDCAHGGLGAPVVPDGVGYFDVGGVHVREHGGPVRIGEVPDSLPARYVGQVSGDRMKLRVVVGPDTLGPFELQLGVAPQLFRCL